MAKRVFRSPTVQKSDKFSATPCYIFFIGKEGFVLHRRMCSSGQWIGSSTMRSQSWNPNTDKNTKWFLPMCSSPDGRSGRSYLEPIAGGRWQASVELVEVRGSWLETPVRKKEGFVLRWSNDKIVDCWIEIVPNTLSLPPPKKQCQINWYICDAALASVTWN